MAEIERILHRLQQLEDEIAETLRRLPAHSAKPPVMADLFELEDEQDMLRKKLQEGRIEGAFLSRKIPRISGGNPAD